MITKRTLPALVLASFLSLVLTACGAAPDSELMPAVSDNATTSTDTDASSEDSQSGELEGKPWVTSVLQNNLPPERPDLKDDMYTSYDYDYLSAHQEEGGNPGTDHSDDLRNAVTAVIKDDSKTNHNLEQLRIFYNQAADRQAIKEAGLSEIQPYLDRIDVVKSIEQMNELLVSDDFPFCPFIATDIMTYDTRTTNIVGAASNLLFCDVYLDGGTFYQETDDEIEQEAAQTQLSYASQYAAADLMTAGMDEDAAKEAAANLVEFERLYGKYLAGSKTYLQQDFGKMAEDMRASIFEPDEFFGFFSNFPMKETLAKLELDRSEKYGTTADWAKAFDGVWVPENLDIIKLMAKASILKETRPYRDKSAFIERGLYADDAGQIAWSACDNRNSFTQIVSQTYVEDCLGAEAKERLTELSKRIINTYKSLVDDTAWLGDESQRRVIEKLDHMTLNVLEPADGYVDYSNLELTPADKGGTLLSNYLKLKKYKDDYKAEMVGQPAIASGFWFSTEPTLNNAFYDPMSNSINILPGYITSDSYTDDMSDEELLADIGYTIAHEISHGFDYAGAQLDAYGCPSPVSADKDVDKFTDKTSALAAYYSSIELKPGVKVDGQNVVTEANADLAGMQVILQIAAEDEDFDYNEFFSSVAKEYAQVMTEDDFALYAADVHPMNNLRTNVNAQMFDTIYDEFGITEGDGMYLAPEKRIVMWGPDA